MGEGEEGSFSVGEESGKKTTGWLGETGEEGWDAGCLVGEEGEREMGLIGDDGEGQEMGDEGVAQVKRTGGEVDSVGKQGAAGRDVGEVSISRGEEIGKEAMGGVSAEGEGEN